MDLSYKNIWRISYPIFLSMLLQQIVGITDVIFMGRLGETALSGAALGSTYFLTVFMVAIGFSLGAQIIMARRNGEGNYAKIGPVFYQTLAVLSAASFVIVALSYCFSPRILRAIISTDEVYDATLSYVNWRFLGFLPLFPVIVIRIFYIATTRTKVLTFVSLLTVISNIILNYTLVFGNFGAPALGIAGSALGSSLSEALALIFLLTYSLLKLDLRKYGLTSFHGFDGKLLKQILRLSVWTMFQQFISLSSWMFFFLAIEHVGETQLAVSNILRSISAFPFIIVNALAITSGTLVSNLIGAGETNRVIPCCNRIIGMAAAAALTLILFLALFRDRILSFYTPDPHLIAFAGTAYFVMLATQLPFIPGFILLESLTGSGQPQKALVIEIISNIAYIAYIGFVILHLRADIAWCWTADAVFNTIMLALASREMYSDRWCCKIV